MSLEGLLTRSYGYMFDLFADPLLITDQAGEIILANQAAREFWPDARDLVGMGIMGLLFGEAEHPPLADKLECMLAGISGWYEIRSRQIVLSDRRSATVHQFTDRTARHILEVKLKEKARVFEAMTESVIITDRWGVVTDVNPACEQMLGTSVREALGQHASKLFPVVAKEKFMQTVMQVLQSLQPVKGEVEYTTVEGLPGYAELTIAPVSGTEGNLTAFVCVWRDVTARIQMERELEDNSARNRAIFVNSPLPILVEDFSRLKKHLDTLLASGVGDLRQHLLAHPEQILECASLIRVLDVNQAAIDLYGVGSMSGLLGNLGVLLPGEGHAEFVDELVMVASGTRQIAWEGWNSKLTGELIRVKMHLTIPPDGSGDDDYSNVLVSIEDITHQKQMELRVERAKREWEAAFDAVSELIVMTGVDGRVLRCNRAVTMALNREFGQIIDQPVEALFGWDVATSGPLSSMAGEVQFPALPGSFNIGSYPLSLSASQIGRIYLISDISAMRQLENNMVAMEKMATIGTLAAGVAHEMNSPLQVITGLSESLLNRLGTNGVPPDLDVDRARRNIDTIRRSGWRCAEIVRSLLTYARPTASAMQKQDLNNVVRDCLLLMEHQLSSWSNITVEASLSDEPLVVTANHNQLVQVMINLLTNARDAMPNGGKISIITGVEQTSGQYELKISDEGTGMSEEVMAKVFDPFFTTKAFGEGTGLGLSIVMGIVRAHGGDIQVASTEGLGTTFTVLLPNLPVAALDGAFPGKLLGRFDD